MERHAAFPNLEDIEGMRKIRRRIVEQHIAEPAADNHPERDIEQEIVDAGGIRHLAAAP